MHAIKRRHEEAMTNMRAVQHDYNMTWAQPDNNMTIGGPKSNATATNKQPDNINVTTHKPEEFMTQGVHAVSTIMEATTEVAKPAELTTQR